MTREEKDTAPPLPRWKKLVFRTALILLLLVACFSIPEVVLRMLYREQEVSETYWGLGAFEPDALSGYRHAAGFTGYACRRDLFDVPVHIGPNNLRQANFKAQMGYPKRVLLLGDSFTFGIGVPEESTFATLLQQPLNARGIGVINGGQCAYGVEQEVRFGGRLNDTVQSDWIILGLFPNNDVWDDYYGDYRNREVKYGFRLPKDRWLAWAPCDFLRTHSYTWMLAAQTIKKNSSRVRNRKTEFKHLAETRTEEVLQPTLDALEALRGYCGNRDIKLGVVMIPTMAGGTPFDAPLKAVFQKKGIPFLDLGQKGFVPGHYFRGDGHWNEAGHRKAATHIASFCLSLMEPDPGLAG